MAGRRWRRDQRDREIAGLALPALGALVAEPLYVLTDTAVVGRLGTPELGGLAVAGTVLTTGFWLFGFLVYGTTAAVARATGAGRSAAAARHAVQGLWLAVALGAGLTVLGLVAAPAAVGLMGADDAVRPHAVTYLRISALGAPAVLVALVGVGYLRGLRDTAGPLRITVIANVANLIGEMALIYGAGLGVGASAATTVAVQTGAAAVYVRSIVRHGRAAGVAFAPDPAALRALLTVGSSLFVRTGSLQAALALAMAVASRLGAVPVAAHQIAFQLWMLLALAVDALAIAGQAMIGHRLGAGRADDARAAARRLLQWGMVVGLVFTVAVTALRPILPRLFTGDPRVVSLAADVLWFVGLLQPLNAAVFVLDGVLIGAGDMRFLAVAMLGALAVFAPTALAVSALGWPLPALWAALGLFMVTRLVTMVARYAGLRWAVVGPPE